MTYQAMCSQVWLDVSDDSRITGQIDSRGDVQFTVSCEHDEFELVFPPPMLRRFVDLATGLLAQADAGRVDCAGVST